MQFMNFLNMQHFRQGIEQITVVTILARTSNPEFHNLRKRYYLK